MSYKVKDAIVDFFREKTGQRPNISVASPDIKFNVHISDKSCTLSLDSSGESLHKRGYRQASVESPINEVLAAAMIMMTGWDGECDFIDPMCGSGTLLIEAALIARNMAPGIFRKNYAFEKWKDFDAELFEKIYNDDSKEREFTHHIYGYDQDWEAIAAAMQNVKAAGVTSDITLTVQPIQKFTQPEEKAIMVTNPPYGERISSPNLLSLYRTIGEKLKHQFVGNEAWIIGYREETFDNIGLRPSLKVSLYNGALNCTFCKYSIFSGRLNEFRSQGGVMKSDEERHRNAERKIFKPRREHVQNENTEFMEEDEIPDFIIRRHNEFVANQRREAHRSRREEDSRERKDYKKEYSSHSDRPRKDDERKFSGPKRPFDKGRGGGFKKNFGSHSKGGFQRRGKED